MLSLLHEQPQQPPFACQANLETMDCCTLPWISQSIGKLMLTCCRSGPADLHLCAAHYVCAMATSVCIGRHLPRLRLTAPVSVGDVHPQPRLHSPRKPGQQCPCLFVAHSCFPDLPSRPSEAHHSSTPAVVFATPPPTSRAPPPPYFTFFHELQLQLPSPSPPSPPRAPVAMPQDALGKLRIVPDKRFKAFALAAAAPRKYGKIDPSETLLLQPA